MSSKLRAVILALLVLSAVSASPALARTDAEIRQTVADIVAQRHPKDSPDTWRNLGSGAPPVIIRMYSESDDVYEKARLLGGLAWFPGSAEAVDFLKSEAGETREPTLRQVAIRSVAESQGTKAVDFVSKFLDSPDPQTRLEAAQALRRMNDARARDLLEAYLKNEKAPWIAQRLRDERPEPPLRLAPVAVSEDRAVSPLEGEWKGLLLRPDAGAGFRSSEIGARIEPQPMALAASPTGGKPLRMRLTLEVSPWGSKGRVRSFDLSGLQAKGTRLSGALPPELLPKGATGGFEGEIAREGGGMTLVLRSAASGTMLILRKQ